MKNHYAVLGVHRKSTPEEMQEARRRLAREAHPDLGGDVARMMDINAAYAALHDPAQKRRYDILLGAAGHTCHSCGGEGSLKKQRGFTRVTVTICPKCGGAGVIMKEEK